MKLLPNYLHLILSFCVLFSLFFLPALHAEEPPKDILQKAETLLTDKKYSEALGLYERVIAADPSCVQAYRDIVTCYGKLGNPQGAIKFMNALFLDHARSGEVHYGMGYALFQVNKYEDAAQYFDKAIQLKPDLAAAWNNRAAIYHFVANDYVKARQYYEKAIEISTRTGNDRVLAVARENLATLPSAEDLKPLALEEFLNSYIAKADANDSQAVRRLVLGQKKNCEQALDWFLNEALRAGAEGSRDEEKTTLALAALLANEYTLQHKSDALRKKLQAYTSLPEDKKKKIFRGESMLRTGMEKEQQGLYEEARKHYREAFACFESTGDKNKSGLCLLYLGDASRALKQFPEARKEYSDALSLFIETRDERQRALALSSLGITCSLLGEHGDALDFLKRSLTIYTSLKDVEAQHKVKKNIEMIEAKIKDKAIGNRQ